MPLSKHHIDTNTHPVAFDLERLGYALESELTDVLFAYVHGSAAHTGVVAPHSDLDIALLDDHAHEYEEIDPKILFQRATGRLDDFLTFRDEIDRAGQPLPPPTAHATKQP